MGPRDPATERSQARYFTSLPLVPFYCVSISFIFDLLDMNSHIPQLCITNSTEMLQFNPTALIRPFAKKKKTHTLEFRPNCLLPWKYKIILVRKCYIVSTNISAKVQSVAGEILAELHPVTWELFSTSYEITNGLSSCSQKIRKKLKKFVTLQEALGIFALLGLKPISKKQLLFPSYKSRLHVKDIQLLILMTIKQKLNPV